MSYSRLGPGRRNLAAECRALEEGHRCRLDRERGVFIVPSDSRPGRHYELVAWGEDEHVGLLHVSCVPCPTSARDQEPGVMSCKHRALVARRLEREGLVMFDGKLWRVKPSVDVRLTRAADMLKRVTAYESRGPRCPRCDEIVDEFIDFPPERIGVVLNGVAWHRGCAGRAGTPRPAP